MYWSLWENWIPFGHRKGRMRGRLCSVAQIHGPGGDASCGADPW